MEMPPRRGADKKPTSPARRRPTPARSGKLKNLSGEESAYAPARSAKRLRRARACNDFRSRTPAAHAHGHATSCVHGRLPLVLAVTSTRALAGAPNVISHTAAPRVVVRRSASKIRGPSKAIARAGANSAVKFARVCANGKEERNSTKQLRSSSCNSNLSIIKLHRRF